MEAPPSIGTQAPFIIPAEVDVRKTIVSAISSGFVGLLFG